MKEKSTFEGKGVKGVANYYLTHTRKENGITLVALVITIIILVILAGVTVSQLSGNGLFSKTQKAKEMSDTANIKEHIQLIIYEKNLEKKGELTLQDIVYELEEDDKYEYKIMLDNGTIIEAGNLTVDSKSIIVVCENSTFRITSDLQCTILDNNYVEEIGETADEIVLRLGEEAGAGASIAGNEVTYIKYKDKEGNQQNKWIIVYVGKNKDTTSEIAADMPINENHIYLLPKYSIASIRPASETITLNNITSPIEAQIDTTAGYSSTPSFRDAMRNSSIWNAYSRGNGSMTHGAMSVMQYNMCVTWSGTYSSLSNGEGYWLDDPTWSNAIARVDGSGARSGNGLSYWTDSLTIRPFVMLGTNCKLTNDYRIIY